MSFNLMECADRVGALMCTDAVSALHNEKDRF